MSKENHFPFCSTFQQDPISLHWYCVECGADERNVLAAQDDKEAYKWEEGIL